MSNFVKPQSPIYNKTTDTYIYPLTTSDQVIMPDGTRLDDNVGGTKRELLWTNVSPLSNFPEQTLTISNLSKYKWLMIGCTFHTGNHVFWNHVITGEKTFVISPVNNDYYSPSLRVVSISGDTITFSTGYYTYNSETATHACVPVYIYGIKE